ncbi:MAG: hypothetical protein HZB23_14305 [Deltaproteobacteria bacterium]|nr:hypothetical protein [Deltaproteobacteria bacterium]
MPKKYHIDIKEAPARFVPVGRSTILDWEGGCLRCFKCVKRLCIYDAYNKRDFDATRLADTIDSVCKNCLRCVQMCPGRVISKKENPEYKLLGDSYWTADIIVKQSEMAATGKIPVSGAGYRGPFTGPGFDSMWTDMSEIVRPTRDGIHGREYINTSVSLGRKRQNLSFDESGAPVIAPLCEHEIPVPMIFAAPPLNILSENVLKTFALAAENLGMLTEIPVKNWGDFLTPHLKSLVPVMGINDVDAWADLIAKVPMAGFVANEVVPDDFVEKFKARFPGTLLMVKIPADERAPRRVPAFAEEGTDVMCLVADVNGKGMGENSGKFISQITREVHGRMVDLGVRDSVTLLLQGGVALAEHVAKAVICGADAVMVDLPVLLALECTYCGRCNKGLACPVQLENVNPEWGKKRVGNFMAAWRNQIIEVLGAMGIREIRRLRGEVGRAMFFDDLERDTFGRLFGKKKAVPASEGANP